MLNPINFDCMNSTIRFLTMNLPIFLLLFLNGIVGFTQSSAGPDKTICKDGNVVIGPTPIDGNCYYWEPDDGTLNNIHTCNPIATPAYSTEYTLTIVSPDFSSKNVYKMKVDVVEVKIEELSFLNDHVLTDWYSNPKLMILDPVWIRTTNWNKEICYTKGTHPTVKAKISVLNLTQNGGNPNINCNYSLHVKDATSTIIGMISGTINGTTIEPEIGFNESYTIINSVQTTSESFYWEIKLSTDEWCSIGVSGPHKIFWTENDPPNDYIFSNTMGTLFLPLYNYALEKACGYVNGNSDIRKKITQGIAIDIQQYCPWQQLAFNEHPLLAYDNSYCVQCTDFSSLLNGLLRSIGITDGETTFIWAGSSTSLTTYCENSDPACNSNESNITFQVQAAQKGQIGPNPHFRFHAVVNTGNALYDPTYGEGPFLTLTFLETAGNSRPMDPLGSPCNSGQTPQMQSIYFPSSNIYSGCKCQH
jgi:hypothetical protein